MITQEPTDRATPSSRLAGASSFQMRVTTADHNTTNQPMGMTEQLSGVKPTMCNSVSIPFSQTRLCLFRAQSSKSSNRNGQQPPLTCVVNLCLLPKERFFSASLLSSPLCPFHTFLNLFLDMMKKRRKKRGKDSPVFSQLFSPAEHMMSRVKEPAPSLPGFFLLVQAALSVLARSTRALNVCGGREGVSLSCSPSRHPSLLLLSSPYQRSLALSALLSLQQT